MGSKQCGKCGEEVPEAKAFCPGCGHAFVEEEKRAEASEFDRSNKTVQLGKTMYGQLLSDMGLNIAKKPDKRPNSVEVVIAPLAASPPPEVKPVDEKPSRMRWMIIAVAIVLVLGFLLLLAAAIIIFLLWPRLV